MNKCPKCGACRTIGRMFVCGSRYIGVDDTELSRQSELCKDIEHDKKHIEFMHKWRDVVLSKVFIDIPDFKPCHWAIDLRGCSRKLAAHETGNAGVKQAFDAAVRKEMGQ